MPRLNLAPRMMTDVIKVMLRVGVVMEWEWNVLGTERAGLGRVGVDCAELWVVKRNGWWFCAAERNS